MVPREDHWGSELRPSLIHRYYSRFMTNSSQEVEKDHSQTLQRPFLDSIETSEGL